MSAETATTCRHAGWEMVAMTYGSDLTSGPLCVELRCARCGELRWFDARDNGSNSEAQA